MVGALRSTTTIRERCCNILSAVENGQSAHFRIQREHLPAVAAKVEAVTRQQYPDLQIPYHSRWRHFEAGAVDRKALLDQQLTSVDSIERARTYIDLTLISVLLDAGAGAQWHYREATSGKTFARSEGLGVASFHGFLSGAFSVDPAQPLRVDATALLNMDASVLGEMFQVTGSNPLVGLEGRARLLQRLGECLLSQRAVFGEDGRPGRLFDWLTANGQRRTLTASAVLEALLAHLNPIWLTGNTLQGVALGDCWQHPLAGGTGPTTGWVPFHKLSQWLTYSLLEPLQWCGIAMEELDGLTGLPEYRNGGLLLDMQVIVPRDPAFFSATWNARDEAIIEWRALTVALLDAVAPLVRKRLNKTAAEMPLACILEGGTWAAGRVVARELREGGPPPLNIASDGTVF